MEQPARIRQSEPSDQDYQAVAAVATAFTPDETYDYEFRSAAEIRALDEAFAQAGLLLKRYLAEHAGRIIGYAYYFQIAWAPPAGRYWCVIRVHPEFQRRGIGGQLYTRVVADLMRQGASALQIEVHETLDELLVPLARRGFRELLRSWPFSLDPRRCDLARYQPAFQRLDGLVITTLAQEQARDPDWLPKLYKLHIDLSRDVPIPGYPLPTPPIVWFAELVAGLPVSLPEAFFIVREGQRYVAE
jgi:GNAT superfamily N-acetyltransferase